MLNQNIFNYDEERREAIACHNIALWYKIYEEQKRRDEYYFNLMIEDDYNRCTRGF